MPEINVSHLDFLEKYKEAGEIKVRVSRNKFSKITKENIIKSVEMGLFKFPLHQFFTPASIKKASEAEELATEKKSKKELKDGKG